MLLLFGVQALLKFGNAYVLGNASEKIVADLKIRVYDHLQALPLSFFHQRRQGDTLALLTHDVYVISGYVSGTVLATVPLLFTVAGAVFFMFRLEPLLALLAAALIPLFFLLLKVFGRRIRPLATQLRRNTPPPSRSPKRILACCRRSDVHAQAGSQRAIANRSTASRSHRPAAEDRGGAETGISSSRPPASYSCWLGSGRSPAASSRRPSS
jgi:ABC-type multidrug transport system fused ATPase/permease subunit